MAKKILMLADIASPHTQKWAGALAQAGYEVGLFSGNQSTSPWHKAFSGITVLHEGPPAWFPFPQSKLIYVFLFPKLYKCIGRYKPAVLHAHYASSYGFLGALSRFKPLFISAWGSDVFEFPKKSPMLRVILQWSLTRAERLFSTSWALERELRKYTLKPIAVIPFGVNTHAFHPNDSISSGPVLRIGLIKSMEEIYGIDTVLEAALALRTLKPLLPVEFLLVGGGSKLEQYKQLSKQMAVHDIVVFTGRVSYSEVPAYHRKLDIFLNMSRVDESFGVSVLEAMASGKPVVVSNVPGMREIVMPGTGIIIEKENPQQLAKALLELCESPTLRQRIGSAARQHVQTHYEFNHNLHAMMEAYDSVMDYAPASEKQISQSSRI